MNNEFKRMQELAGIKENTSNELDYYTLKVGDKLRVVKEAYPYRQKLQPTRFDTDNKTRYSGFFFYTDNKKERNKKDSWSSQFDSVVKLGDTYTITKVIPSSRTKYSYREPKIWAESNSDPEYNLSDDDLKRVIISGALELVK